MLEINLQTLLAFQFGGVSAERLAIAVAVFLVLLIAFRIFRGVVLRHAKRLAGKTKTDFDDLLVAAVDEVPHYFYAVVAAFIGFQFVQLDAPFVVKTVSGVFLVLVVYRVVVVLQKFISYVLTKILAGKGHRVEENQTAINGIKILVKIVLWSAGLLLVLSNLGLEVGTLVASLGIGGIAVAFALQNILSDLFSSFAIYFDQPFKIGDYVVIGKDSGTVLKIGLKTTRIQSLQGEEIVFSNAELTSARIRNFKKMKHRRANFGFGVVYSTTSAQLKKIPQLVEKVIGDVKLADFSRCHFREFGDFSLNFEAVYHVHTRDYAKYMDTQQAINLGIKAAFEQAKIEMAFPTQTLYVQKS